MNRIKLRSGQVVKDRAGNQWTIEEGDILLERYYDKFSDVEVFEFNDLNEKQIYYSYTVDWNNEGITENEELIFFETIEDAETHALQFIKDYNYDEAFTEDAILSIYPFIYYEDYEEWEIGDRVLRKEITVEGFLSLKVDFAKDIIEYIEKDIEDILLKYYPPNLIEINTNFSRVSESSYINIEADKDKYKIRVSTHQLPDKYEQPDLEIRFDSSFLNKDNTLDYTMIEIEKQKLYRNFEKLVRDTIKNKK